MLKVASGFFLPPLGLSLVHRTTREWWLGGSAYGSDGDLSRIGSVLGIAATLAMGAGLVLLIPEETRARARRLLANALPSRRISDQSASAMSSRVSNVDPRNANPRDAEDADACDAC